MTKEKVTYKPQGWRLDALFPGHDSPEMQAAFDSLESQVAEFENHRENLTADIAGETFIAIVLQMEAIYHKVYRVYSFASLWFSENTQNQDAQTFLAKVQQVYAGLYNRMIFFSLWWKALDDQNAARLMDGSGDYRYFLHEMRNLKPYTLTEAEEKIINIKDLTGANAFIQLYETITNRYVFKLVVDGEEKELTQSELTAYFRNPDPELRARAYTELLRVYGNDAPALNHIYQSLVRDWRNENVDLRKYAAPISVRNIANDVPDPVVDVLLEVCQRNAVLFQRFFRLKARWIGANKLSRYDIYVPVTASDKHYSYDDAVRMVFDAFDQFHPSFTELAQRLFDEDRIDSEIRKGKSGGAFCASVTNTLTPFVLLNYEGQARNVATLAHELGHAIHSQLAFDQTLFTYHSPLPMAETASTFAEMLLVDYLLAEETDEQVKMDILFRQLDDAYATIMRQSFFALFEKQAHEMIHQGASMDDLAEAYLENLHNQFGDAVDISDDFRWEWVYVSHIFSTPFYVYAYAFGQLLVFSLYQQYKADGEAFKPAFIKILSAGGSAAPADILAEASIDITSESFWQGGFDVVADLVDQLEAVQASK